MSTNPSPVPESPATSMASAPKPSGAMLIFLGPKGLRAFWRIVIFIALLAALGYAVNRVVRAMHLPRPQPSAAAGIPVVPTIVSEAVFFLLVVLATAIMAKFEKRRLGAYGIPLRGAFGGKFWEGALWGFGSLTLLLGSMRLLGSFYFGTVGLSGREIYRYAALWALAMLMVAFFEELFSRGYMQFTIARHGNFWVGALILSAVFGLGHVGNTGESWVGVANAAGIGLFFCLALERTGTLWFPIGYHMAWNWGESYFYGTADSGALAQGHLLNSSAQGSHWITGGTVGPEGSLLCTLLIAVMTLALHKRFPEVRYKAE